MIPRILMVIHQNWRSERLFYPELKPALWVSLWITPDVDMGVQKLT